VDQKSLNALLKRLLADGESEVVEFKEAKNQFDSDKLGRYFSALANEANLRGHESGWLVFGIRDDGAVVGTSFRQDPAHLQALKHEVSQKAEPSATFRQIHELQHPDGRVLLLEIPAAPAGIPIFWGGHHSARNGESLGALDSQSSTRFALKPPSSTGRPA
jgi:ATP-dependent DNA helicase RecG